MTANLVCRWVAIALWFGLATLMVWKWGWWALLAGITLGAIRATSLRYGAR